MSAKRSPRSRSPQTARTIALVAALLFGTLAVWLANQEPPRITHAEAMAMAARIERVNEAAALRNLVHFDVASPALLAAVPEFAERTDPVTNLILLRKRHSHTFVGTRTTDEGEPTLLFRCEDEGVLTDYQELRLARRDGQVKICDLWSMAHGGWMWEMWIDALRLLGSNADWAAFGAFVLDDRQDPGQFEDAMRRLPERVRNTRLVALVRLNALDDRDVEQFRAGIAAYRAAHPESLAADMILLFSRPPAVTHEEALGALDRIKARVRDDAYLDRLRTLLRR